MAKKEVNLKTFPREPSPLELVVGQVNYTDPWVWLEDFEVKMQRLLKQLDRPRTSLCGRRLGDFIKKEILGIG